MKILKKLGLALLIATSMGTFSSSVLAGDEGRVTYAPADAINIVIDKIKLAVVGIKSGNDGTKTASLIKEALDSSKEINANDRVDSKRQSANNLLKKAKNHAKDNSLQEAEQELEKAQKDFAALIPLI